MKDKAKRFGRKVLEFLKLASVGLILIAASFGVMVATNNVKAGWDKEVGVKLTEVGGLQAQLTQKIVELQTLKQSSTVFTGRITQEVLDQNDELVSVFFDDVLAWSSPEERDDIRSRLSTGYYRSLSTEILGSFVPSSEELQDESAIQKVVSFHSYLVNVSRDMTYSYITEVVCERTADGTTKSFTLICQYTIGTNGGIYDFKADMKSSLK